MGQGTLTLHFPGMPAATPTLTPLMLLREDLRHLQTIWRSGVVFAAAFRLLTPLQQLSVSSPFPWVQGMHGDNNDSTRPHDTAPAARGGAAARTTASRTIASTGTAAERAVVISHQLDRSLILGTRKPCVDAFFLYRKENPNKFLEFSFSFMIEV